MRTVRVGKLRVPIGVLLVAAACAVSAVSRTPSPGRPDYAADSTQTVRGTRWVCVYVVEDHGERSDATVRWDYRVTFDVDARTGRNRVIGTNACVDVVGSSVRIAIQMGADCD